MVGPHKAPWKRLRHLVLWVQRTGSREGLPPGGVLWGNVIEDRRVRARKAAFGP